MLAAAALTEVASGLASTEILALVSARGVLRSVYEVPLGGPVFCGVLCTAGPELILFILKCVIPLC
jgi:hypothetical protein